MNVNHMMVCYGKIYNSADNESISRTDINFAFIGGTSGSSVWCVINKGYIWI